MRLWCLHPKYLDRAGLLACWRESLLAQKVLQGQTKGYTHHPQLLRFRGCNQPLAAMGTYLLALAQEAANRGYSFNQTKINPERFNLTIPIKRGQLEYEWAHLLVKLRRRDPARYDQVISLNLPDLHPLFRLVPGGMEAWEKPVRANNLESKQ